MTGAGAPRARIAHVAFWTADLERLAAFWAEALGAEVGPLYESARRPGFRSRFLRLGGEVTVELMSAPWIDPAAAGPQDERAGLAHIAVSLGATEAVDALAHELAQEGRLLAPPRWTGDGFYEAIIADPDGNAIEITA
ncbi:VOC family protein [Salinarimonas rosea]|uniref:VOC family protein n=1 Tax=Salinarimonas rosea TaxID=552063 RepID=UPI000420E8E5|nr:VOC family protein [Salinarimonas rosea]